MGVLMGGTVESQVAFYICEVSGRWKWFKGKIDGDGREGGDV